MSQAPDPNPNDSRAFNGETFGEAIIMDRDREYSRDSRGFPQTQNGPEMVADELLRALLTRPGSDPIRPEFGLRILDVLSRADRQQGVSTKAESAIRDVIGPRSDPRVHRIDDISFDRNNYNRVLGIAVDLTLDDTEQTPIRLRAGFEETLQRKTSETERERGSREAYQ